MINGCQWKLENFSGFIFVRGFADSEWLVVSSGSMTEYLPSKFQLLSSLISIFHKIFAHLHFVISSQDSPVIHRSWPGGIPDRYV